MDQSGYGIADPVIVLFEEVARLHRDMDNAYDRLSTALRDRPGNERALAQAQSRADALGRMYEGLCDRICKTQPATIEGVLAKLRCAAQCIRDIVPEGTDPEQACDIELRLVFAVERDVRRLVADARRSKGSRHLGATPRNRGTTSSARGRRLRDLGTNNGASRVT